MTPTARTLARLRQMGYTAAVVERRLPRCFITKDLFGCIDVVGVHPDRAGVLGVQTTTRSNQAKRLAKALALPKLRTWLRAGNRFEVWGWAKVGKRGKRKLWEVAAQTVTLERLPRTSPPTHFDEFAPETVVSGRLSPATKLSFGQSCYSPG